MGLFLSVAVFTILASSLIKSISRIKVGNNAIEKINQKIEKAEIENKKLAEQLKVSQSSEYLEKQFRDKMGLAKEGEIVLVLPEAEIVKRLSPQIPEDIEAKPKSNLEKWTDLFR
jgi:cell division protein FtsB